MVTSILYSTKINSSTCSQVIATRWSWTIWTEHGSNNGWHLQDRCFICQTCRCALLSHTCHCLVTF